MKPSELIKSISPNGCLDTGLMYDSKEPNTLDICTLYKGDVSLDVLDKLSTYNSIDITDVEKDMSLLKTIEHPGQIIGGYAISKELADTITSYFGREALIEAGRPVNEEGYYSEQELTDKTFLNAALLRYKHFTPYNYMHSEVGFNKNNVRSLENAIKAYNLKLSGTKAMDITNIVPPCGSVYFMRDDMISLDSFHIILTISKKEVLNNKQILIDWIPEINNAYTRYRTKNGPIPSNYIKDSGKAIKSLFDVYKEDDKDIDGWETVNTTDKVPMYIGKNNGNKVVTIVGRTNDEIIKDFNSKIDDWNESTGNNLSPVLLSTMGDFFFPIIFSVHR